MGINLVEILKDTPKGTKLYSTIFGEVSFDHIDKDEFYPIKVETISGAESLVTKKAYLLLAIMEIVLCFHLMKTGTGVHSKLKIKMMILLQRKVTIIIVVMFVLIIALKL